MRDFLGFLGALVFFIVMGFLLTFSIFLVIQVVNINFIDNVPIIVKVDGEVVHEGTSASVKISSSGANTSVVIFKKPLYILPEAYYVSDDVQIINRRKNK